MYVPQRDSSFTLSPLPVKLALVSSNRRLCFQSSETQMVGDRGGQWWSPLCFPGSACNVIPSEVPEWVNTPSTCCLKFYEKVLPRRLVVGYRKALNCNLPAIIFITKRNREVCTNPSDDWVQEYIKNPNLPLLPSRNLATVKIITAKND
uniref:C-C motif chemokine n=1 Tax=Macaca fascicularis TaxID=9541 RepID=A0A7N9D6N9_MACFA